MAEINVVPYIDVMLVLLVIFMITAPLLNLGVEVELPKADAEPMDTQENDEPLVITVLQNGDLYLNAGGDLDGTSSGLIDPESLVTMVTAIVSRNPEIQVLVGGDERAELWPGLPRHGVAAKSRSDQGRPDERPAWSSGWGRRERRSRPCISGRNSMHGSERLRWPSGVHVLMAALVVLGTMNWEPFRKPQNLGLTIEAVIVDTAEIKKQRDAARQAAGNGRSAAPAQRRTGTPEAAREQEQKKDAAERRKKELEAASRKRDAQDRLQKLRMERERKLEDERLKQQRELEQVRAEREAAENATQDGGGTAQADRSPQGQGTAGAAAPAA